MAPRKKPASIGVKAPFPGFIEPALKRLVWLVDSGHALRCCVARFVWPGDETIPPGPANPGVRADPSGMRNAVRMAAPRVAIQQRTEGTALSLTPTALARLRRRGRPPCRYRQRPRSEGNRSAA